jgi:PAP2 superfamily
VSTSLIAQQRGTRIPSGEARFHLVIGCVIGCIGVFSLVGCWLTSVRIPDVSARLSAELILLCAFQALPVYLHSRGKIAWRDSALMILWAILLWRVLPFAVDFAARLSRRFSLRDEFLARADRLGGVHIATIVHWASHNAMGRVLNASYFLLGPLLALACLVPSLVGRLQTAKQFLIANLAAFAIGLPLLIVFPAVGPWTAEHFLPRPDQALCQSAIEQVRAAGDCIHQAAGVICFPSFHVMWAILSAWTLFPVRGLRWLSTVLAAAIVLSTMTTGWHYMMDVLGGIILAGVSIAIARTIDCRLGDDRFNRSSRLGADRQCGTPD